MSIINIISAVGNNRGIAPLVVRDCCIEAPTKVGLTYKQNLKDSKQMANNAARERFIDEYFTSAIWIGGPILFNAVGDKIIKKSGLSPKISMNLFKKEKKQGIQYNINKFKEKAPNEIMELEKALKNKSKLQNLQALKFLISTMIPIAFMGFILPKLNFKLTEKIKENQNNKSLCIQNSQLSFKGALSTMSSMSNVNKMAVTDGGLTIGRVMTGRNRYEQLELGFKNVMMMFLNFVFPIYMAKYLDNITKRVFGINVNLDPKLMADNKFLNIVKNRTLKMPNQKENIVDFLDANPNSEFSKLCEKYCGVKYLKSRIRDPRKYVDINKIESFKNELNGFIKEVGSSDDIKKYGKKALRAKSVNIIANVAISSFLLSVALPELIFLLRRKITGSDAEPGLS